MTASIFREVKDVLQCRLADVIRELLPGGKVSGREYQCASLQGGAGSSCVTNMETGRGSDFATGESWGDIVGLAAKVWNVRQGKAARGLADRYGIRLDGMPQTPRPAPSAVASSVFTPIAPVPGSAPQAPRIHPQHGQASALWRYTDEKGRTCVWPWFTPYWTARSGLMKPTCKRPWQCGAMPRIRPCIFSATG